MAWYWLTVGFRTVGEAGREFTRLSCQALMPMTAAASRSKASTAAATDAVRPKPNIKEPPFMRSELPSRTSTRFLRSVGTRVSPTASRSRWRIWVSFIGEYLRAQAQALEGSIRARLRCLRRDSQRLGDLFVGEVEVEPQDDDETLVVWQAIEGSPEVQRVWV